MRVIALSAAACLALGVAVPPAVAQPAPLVVASHSPLHQLAADIASLVLRRAVLAAAEISELRARLAAAEAWRIASPKKRIVALKVAQSTSVPPAPKPVSPQPAPKPAPVPPQRADNTVRLANVSGARVASYPLQFGRPFVCGEIAHYPQALIDGTLALTQADAKNRCPDGSVKFAVIAVMIPALPASGAVTLTFRDQPSGNNTPLTSAEMLDPAYNF